MKPNYVWWSAVAVGLQLAVEVDPRVVICTFSGVIDDAGILCVRGTIAAHPDFAPGLSEILDFSGVTAAHLSTNAIQFRINAWQHSRSHFNAYSGRQARLYFWTRPHDRSVRTGHETERCGGAYYARSSRTSGCAKYPPNRIGMVAAGLSSPVA